MRQHLHRQIDSHRLDLAHVTERRGRPFAAYLAYGIGLLIALQAFVNIGVNVGLLPTKGLTLPLVSFGGSSLLVCCAAVGLLLRTHFELAADGFAGRRPSKARCRWDCRRAVSWEAG